MNKLTIKGTIPSFSDKNSIVKLSIEVSDEKINLDELKRLLDKELVISLDDSQTNLDEFPEEEEPGGKD
jgi:tetrahydromethanopterin S-methyltransferase subunit B